MTLNSFNGACNVPVIKFSLNFNGTISLFKFGVHREHSIAEFSVFLLSFGWYMIKCCIISATWELKCRAELFNKLFTSISLNKGHVFSY